MRYLVLLKIKKNASDLLHNRVELCFIKDFLLLHEFVKLASWTVFHDNEKQVAPFPNFDNIDNIRVVYFGHHRVLIGEHLHIIHRYLFYSFDCYLLKCPAIARKIDHSKRALAYIPLKMILTLYITFFGEHKHAFMDFRNLYISVVSLRSFRLP